MKPRFSLLVAGAAVALLGSTGTGMPARADFKVCNQTLNFLNLAVGYWVPETELYQTEGWWTLTANSCTALIREPLTVQYVYVYGTDIYGDEAISGSDPMCISSKGFVIPDKKDCWVRGYETVRFLEVDTKNASTWTMFIRED